MTYVRADGGAYGSPRVPAHYKCNSKLHTGENQLGSEQVARFPYHGTVRDTSDRHAPSMSVDGEIHLCQVCLMKEAERVMPVTRTKKKGLGGE